MHSEISIQEAWPNLSVTAIIPTFNRSAYILESLQSLLDQTIPLAQIIVVDDGSTDDTAQKLFRLGDKIKYIYQENGGKAAALNRGLEMVSDGLVWIFDDDDVARNDAIETLIAGFQSNSGIGFTYGRNDVFGKDGNDVEFRYALDVPDTPPEAILGALLNGMFINQGAMLARRSCYERVGPFDTNLVRCQDYDMMLRIAQHFRGLGVPRIVYSQREHNGTRGTKATPIKAADMRRAWLEHDQLIMKKLLPMLTVEELSPRGCDCEPPLAVVMRAHLKKFVVLVRVNLPAMAAEELGKFAELSNKLRMDDIGLSEKGLLRRALDEHSRGLEGFANSLEIQRALKLFSSPRLRASIEHALLYPISFGFRHAIRTRSSDQLKLTFRTLSKLRGGAYAVKTLASVYFAIAKGRLTGRGDYDAARSEQIAQRLVDS